ncbi:MAG: hypothetical protein U0L11_06155 [Acutalibacteraceae bacterium]|nr:hypothetical protein [Acutalibacteraceae bacterium]
MRTLRIDFSAENMLPDGEYIGRIGEHNATSLIITPPAEMAECEAILNYVAAFVTEGKIIRSDFYPKSDQVEIPLCAQLTQDHSLGVQLEGYDDKGGLVVKSAVIGELKLLPSAGGDATDFDSENGGMVSQINLNTLARHEHSNTDVLSGLGEKNGILTYNGESVVSQKLKTVVLDIAKDNVMIETSGTSLVFSVMNSDENTPFFPDNTDIISVEYNLFGEDEWTDIRSIMKYNPYITVISQTLKTFTCDGCNYFAVVDFPSGEFNEFYQHVMSYRINKISVTYAENTVA